MLQLSMIGPPEGIKKPSARHRLYRTVSDAIAARFAGLDVEASLIHEAADAVAEHFTSRPQSLSNREALIRMDHGHPKCWVCGFGIPLDVPHDSPASFSVDHVIPRSEGGGVLGISNLKPAHRFCNNIRNAQTKRSRTQQRYESFLESLRM